MALDQNVDNALDRTKHRRNFLPHHYFTRCLNQNYACGNALLAELQTDVAAFEEADTISREAPAPTRLGV